MYDEERGKRRRLYVASLKDDIPILKEGSLIPRRVIFSAPEQVTYSRLEWYIRPGILLTASVLIFGLSLGSAAYSMFSGSSSVAAPIVAPVATQPFEPEPFNYGLLLTYEEETADDAFGTLFKERADFIELDLEHDILKLYASGTVSTTLPVLQKPKSDSWWYIPTGSYEITTRTEREYSAFANLYFPDSIRFGENYYIHGIPSYPDGELVPDGYEGGGIRLADSDAALLFGSVAAGTPVVVRGNTSRQDFFIYETEVPGVRARQYLVADLESSAVLAAQGLSERAPIASVTKLMTALVAAENIDLDQTVSVTDDGNTFVTTIIPRLNSENSVTMYSLLQLLLVESSNEAGEVIADAIGRDTFVALMNDTAESIGLTDTTFSDPSGLSSGNASTVGDLFRLMQYIHDNRGFILELTRDQHLPTAYTNGDFGQLANFNFIDGVQFVAGKVGYTEAAGQTSVSLHALTVQGEDRMVAVIILGSDARNTDVEALVSFVASRYSD